MKKAKNKMWLWITLTIFMAIIIGSIIISNSIQKLQSTNSQQTTYGQAEYKKPARCGSRNLIYDDCDIDPYYKHKFGCIDINCAEKSQGTCVDCYCYSCWDEKGNYVDESGKPIK